MEDLERNILNRLILLQCRQGKQEGFETLVDTWQAPLFYYIKRLVENENDTWDVMQDVWLRVFRGIRELRSPEALPAWLYRIAHNTAMSFFRRNKRLMEDQVEDIESDASDNELPSGISAAAVHEALGKLPVQDREALTLHFLEGYLVDEIAEITEAPVGTVKSRLARGKRKLRSILEREDQ
jgi:RNA polymerase sigma-70 factor, ECF subfamily